MPRFADTIISLTTCTRQFNEQLCKQGLVISQWQRALIEHEWMVQAARRRNRIEAAWLVVVFVVCAALTHLLTH